MKGDKRIFTLSRGSKNGWLCKLPGGENALLAQRHPSSRAKKDFGSVITAGAYVGLDLNRVERG